MQWVNRHNGTWPIRREARQVAIACFFLIAATAATASAVEDRRAMIEGLVGKLGDQDAAVRRAAQFELMGLSADDLPRLRETVAGRSLGPEQTQGLREVVLYVKARQRILAAGLTSRAFLGLQWSNPMVIHGNDGANVESPGVAIEKRLRGLVVSRYLEDGDIVLAMGPPDALEPVRQRVDILNAMRALMPGSEVEMRIQRGAAVLMVRFAVDAHPRVPVTDADGITRLVAAAEAEAEAYWNQHFGPLLPDESI